MLYLIKLDSYYKIGFSNDVKKRLKQLSPTHVEVELISTKFGNEQDEKTIHLLCEKFKVKNELFIIDKEVEQIFNTYTSEHLQKSIKRSEEVWDSWYINSNNIIDEYREQIKLQKEYINSLLALIEDKE